MAGLEAISALSNLTTGTGVGTSGIGAWGPSDTTVNGGTTLTGLTGTGATSSVSGTTAVDDGGFAGMLAQGIESLSTAQKTTDDLAVQAATGTLKDPADYTLAASRTELMTQLTVAVRDKAVSAFNEIMRMSL